MNKYFSLLTKGTDIKIDKILKCVYCSKEYALFDLENKILNKHGFKETSQCSTCTFRMLNSYFNDKHLYIRDDSNSNKKIISMLSENYKGNVIEAKEYRKMILNDLGLKYGKNISENIFSDFIELYKKFPKPSRLIYPGLENSDYSSHVGWAKNVYLSSCVFNDCENIFYSFKIISQCRNIYNSYNIYESSNIHNSLVLGKCHNVSYTNNSVNCSNLIFCTDMNNCSECIFCCNLVNKKYMIFNKKYEKEEYFKIKNDISKRLLDYNKFQELEKKYNDFLEKNYISNGINMNNCENVVGEGVFYSKNSINVFSCNGVENCINIFNVGDEIKDVNVNLINSIEAGTNCENFVGVCSVGMNAFNVFFSKSVIESKNIYYSIDIEGCEEIMFSVGLKNKKYCILNKQYEKKDYFELKKKIITDLQNENKWGKYFGFSLSPYPYNDTLAYDYFKVNKVIYPNGKEEVIDKEAIGIVKIKNDDFISDAELDLGGEKKIKIKRRTKNKEINIAKEMEVIDTKNIPNINEVTDDILNKTIICEETGRPFRILKQELDFLKKKGFPLPRIHHELRIDKLLKKRQIGQMYLGKSDFSGDDILSVYKDKPKYKVYSSEEYRNYMYK